VALALSACGTTSGSSGAASSAPGVTAKTVTIGLVTSLSGPASSSFGQAAVEGANARVQLQNAAGGVHGRIIKLVTADDGSSTTQVLTAVQSLDSKGVFAIAAASIFMDGAYRYTLAHGIPVTGGVTSSAYGNPQNTDMFLAGGSYDQNYPAYTLEGKFFKSQGVGVVGCVGANDNPSAVGGALGCAISAKHAGLKSVVNLASTIGSLDVQPIALSLKNAHIQGIETVQVAGFNIALITALEQLGVKLKTGLVVSGYDQSLLDDPAVSAVGPNVGFTSQWAPTELKTPATITLMNALAKYAHYTQPNPTAGQMYGWFAADLAIKGLEVAGANPTRASFISNLRKVHDYNAGGLTAPVDLSKWNYYDSTGSGNCLYVSVIRNHAFVPLSKRPYCGTQIPGTDTVK
jgi:branched-chain amino acid transport system substrate-binding protein